MNDSVLASEKVFDHMTKTMSVRFRGKSFWVYDVVGGIFLWHLVDAAQQHQCTKVIPWLNDCIERWQVAAAITELSFFADDAWTEEQLDLIVQLSHNAIAAIRSHGSFTHNEISALKLTDDLEVHPRGHEAIASEPIALFGEAFVSLLIGRLPTPPERQWWFYSLGESPGTIKMAVNYDEC